MGEVEREPRRLLVTGGAGFVGSNFVHWVARNHPRCQVTVLDALTYAGNLANLDGAPAGQVQFVRGSILDASLVDALVAQADAVVHFAAETHNDRAIDAPAPFVETNIMGTFCLLEAARAHGVRFHHVSTDEVFGSLEWPPAAGAGGEGVTGVLDAKSGTITPDLIVPVADAKDESGTITPDLIVPVGAAVKGCFASDTFANPTTSDTFGKPTTSDKFGNVGAGGVASDTFGTLGAFTEGSQVAPRGPYSASKAASDLLVLAWHSTYGLAATVSNCGNNFGPRQHVEKFIPRQVTNILCGRAPRLYGAGRNVRDWIFVDDHSAAVWACLTRGRAGERYVVGAGCQLENAQVVAKICDVMGWPPELVEHVADRPGHDAAYALDAAKLRAHTGWAPAQADFDAALERTVAWYARNEAWWRAAKRAAEAEYARLGR
jgi:dTDP-D-glucose 4,6-dehydratase